MKWNGQSLSVSQCRMVLRLPFVTSISLVDDGFVDRGELESPLLGRCNKYLSTGIALGWIVWSASKRHIREQARVDYPLLVTCLGGI